MGNLRERMTEQINESVLRSLERSLGSNGAKKRR